MLKIWISGSNGQIGKAINSVLEPLQFEVFNTDKDEVDIADVDEVFRFGEVNRPDIIINCSGVTDMDYCEANPKEAYRVNAIGARNLSIVARKIDAKIVQISTDDVFDGKSTKPYKEFDTPNPRTVYGKSKLAGENYVKEFTHKHFVIRSTWVYGKGNNYIFDLLEAVKTGKPVAVAADQFGAPTSAKELAKFVLHIVSGREYGTYHATCKGTCSRYAYAKEILKMTGKTAKLKAVPTLESDLTSVRPAYAVLDGFIMDIVHVYEFLSWKESLEEFLREEGLYEQ
ncbi:MAG: dTDP-4-dehydrorhamnose reductase [Anaerostipes sp.]|nr:dTDP-4-dehydrorhamnose reductase [Anaerostipes sp.]